MSHLSANDHLCHVTDISENTGFRKVICYFSENCMIGIPTRNDIVAENDERLTAILEDALSKHQDIPFMAVDVKESTKFINGQTWYVLRLYGPLINDQKAVV